MADRKYKYHVTGCGMNQNNDSFQKWLDQMDSAGWEFVGSEHRPHGGNGHTIPYFIFKRPFKACQCAL